MSPHAGTEREDIISNSQQLSDMNIKVSSGRRPIEFDGRSGASSSTLQRKQESSKIIDFIKTKDQYTLSDFKVKLKLGKGAFGNVYLVELDPKLNAVVDSTSPLAGKQFAMKVINKQVINE